MPSVDGVYYETAGEGPETVTFLGDVGYGPWQWAWQAPRLAGPYRTLVPTRRGCGRSAPPPATLDEEALLAALESVFRAAEVRQTHLVAAGLGGLLALSAARELDRVRQVAVLGTPRTAAAFDAAAMYADPTDESAVRQSMAAVLTESFRADQPEAVEQIVDWRTAEDASPTAVERTREALTAIDPDPLYEVTTETLVVHGDADRISPPESGRQLADALPRGELYRVPEAGHLVGCEAARLVTDRLFQFLPDPTE